MIECTDRCARSIHSDSMMEGFKKRIQQTLAACPIRVLQQQGRPRAAILVPIVEQHRQPHFLLTLRTHHVATHKGQVSFPGGMFDVADVSLGFTALRETQEELGIPPTQIEVLGQFHDYLAVTDVLVTPFVGFIEAGARLSPNPREVEKVLNVPLEFFRRTKPRSELVIWHHQPSPLYFYDYAGEVVWGLTARIIKEFLALLDE